RSLSTLRGGRADHVTIRKPAREIVEAAKAADQNSMRTQIARALSARYDNRSRAVAAQRTIKQAERRYDQPRFKILGACQRLLHLSRRILQRVLTKRNCHCGELLARRAEFMHMPLGAKGMRRDRAEIAIFRAEFLCVLRFGARQIAHPHLIRGMRTRPGI